MTLNGKMALILRYFTEFCNGPYMLHYFTEFVYDVVFVKQLLGLPQFQNLLLIVYGHINTGGWRRGVMVTELVVSTKLLYVDPG